MHTLPPIIEPIAVLDIFITSVNIEPIGGDLYRTTCYVLQRDQHTGEEYRVVVARLIATKDCHTESRRIPVGERIAAH